jgi:hypothetical protein
MVRALGQNLSATKPATSAVWLAEAWSMRSQQHCSPDPRRITWNPAFRKGYEFCPALCSFLNELAGLYDGLWQVEPFWLCLSDSYTDCRGGALRRGHDGFRLGNCTGGLG